MRTCLLSFTFLFFQMSQAATHCACEVGTNPNEKGFYKMGCDIWLNSKKCTTRKIVDRKPSQLLSQFLPQAKIGDVYELGFVGHWLDFSWTIDYVDQQIVPLVKKKGVDVRYDNTACSPMNDPEAVQDYLMDLSIGKKSKLMIKGSQGISIGMWDFIFFGGHANFYAYASTDWNTPKFLPCESVEGKVCSAKHQAGEKGRCYNKQIKRLVWLYCLKPKAPKHAYEWTRI